MKKAKRREHFTIIASILESALDGAMKTRIMYDVNLSYTQLENYISLLIELKLLEVSTVGKVKVYKTTLKGVNFTENSLKSKNCSTNSQLERLSRSV